MATELFRVPNWPAAIADLVATDLRVVQWARQVQDWSEALVRILDHTLATEGAAVQGKVLHEQLTDLQGGLAGEHYHLKASDYAALTDAHAQLTALQTDGSPTFAGLTLSGLNPSQLLATDANKKLESLPVAIYPSLTEIAYVKGVTSAIQTQLNAKEGTITPGATAQYWRGDKTWQTLNQAAVAGLTIADAPTFAAIGNLTGWSPSGTGLHLGYTGGKGTIVSYSYVTSAYLGQQYDASSHQFLVSGTAGLKITISGGKTVITQS